ncbi:MAG TPA: transposase [Chloroflexota bacterium]|nr:transposase [Chloroflexota bacterium]
MVPSYGDLLSYVQHLTPSWRKTQQASLALLVGALLERPCLCLTELARAYPAPERPLRGRLKRLMRFLDNPRLDELALSVRWLKLTYRLGEEPPGQPAKLPLLPVLLDTTYFHPFAALVASVPCGGRGLPVALATYHRQGLVACLPPRASWPDPERVCPERPRRGHRPAAAAAEVRGYLSQNHIEEALVDLVWHLVSRAVCAVLVADRGFARASLLRALLGRRRHFVVRVDADTHVRLDPVGPSTPAAEALAVRPGERRWAAGAAYHKDERVPVNLLAVWDEGQAEPWYLATSLDRADWAEAMYRWRMRIECGNRDEKTGAILREGGDDHRLTSALHLHRLLLAVMAAHWLCALAGLQAHRSLPAGEGPGALALDSAPPDAEPTADVLEPGPAQPPPAVPHRGPATAAPPWMRRFVARGPLSYVRLGLEVLRAPDLAYLVRRLARWLGVYLWSWAPRWRPYQRRYRLRHWWPTAA